MRNNLLILSTLLFSGYSLSQVVVDINTVNLQGVLHVDGAIDNPATAVPSAAQQANDIAVTTSGSVGIGTLPPRKQLHVDVSLQLTNELNTGEAASSSGDSGISEQYLASKGPGNPPAWQSPVGVVPTSNETIISINGPLRAAQEIMVQMTTDLSNPTVSEIGNLNSVIIDNKNRHLASVTSNSFTVEEDGIYEIMLNLQLSSTNGASPATGIWDNTTGNRSTRLGQQFKAPDNELATYTLITAIPMAASHIIHSEPGKPV